MKTPIGCLLLLTLPLATPAAQDPSPIVQGLTSIALPQGGAGPVCPLPGGNLAPIVTGDEDSSGFRVFAAAGGCGSGRVVAAGHDGVLGDGANGLFDTLQFNTQAFDWLAAGSPQVATFLSGHREWARAANSTVLRTSLQNAGWSVSDLGGVVTAGSLAGASVVVIGNAWGDFTTAELDTLEAFVRGGGGIYLAGLGWSFGAANLPTYPMNLLGERLGVAWLSGSISDPTNQHNGGPLFHTFYPDGDLYAPTSALAALADLCSAHPLDLDAHLRSAPTDRSRYVTAAGTVIRFASGTSLDESIRIDLDTEIRGLMEQYPSWLGAAPHFDRTQDSALAMVRAGLAGTVRSALPLDANRLADLHRALGLDDPAVPQAYRTVLDVHAFVLLDNRALSTSHFDAILDHMVAVQGIARDLERMTVRDEWSTDPSERSYYVPGVGVNIFGASALSSPQNQFPSDTAARVVPVFASTVAHEVAHVIDSHHSRELQDFTTRKNALIAAAGTDDLNYLRSQIGGAFFQQYPQEFIASLANVWCIDSVHSLRLAKQRLDQGGRQQPMLQALFMADIYGDFGASTPLFTMDAQGRTTTEIAAITRDGQDRITALCSPTVNFQIRYDTAGDVVSVTERSGGCADSWSDLGNALAGTNGLPLLEGSGDLQFGDPTSIRLSNALPNTQGMFFVGISRMDLPIFGGVLVPQILIDLPMGTDALGEFEMFLDWPVHNVGMTVYLQAWLLDAGGPQGLAASNAVAGTTR